MRLLRAHVDPNAARRAYRVVPFEDLAPSWDPELNYMIPVNGAADAAKISSLRERGLPNVFWIDCQGLEAGDVLVPDNMGSNVTVSYRDTDIHHSLFLTNRCNSNCLMCSQPPTRHDDSWLVEEALDIIRHISVSPATLGLSGGEPLLLRGGLRRVIESIERAHPATRIDVLTNGRLFSEAHLADQLLIGLTAKVQWLIPLYGHADILHDFVVQSPGAFEETLEGLLVLQESAQPIQLRIVLVKPVLENLEELCGFIGRNLPFIREVAFIACEPIGFALANRELCELNLSDWATTLTKSSAVLRRYGVWHLFMNTPLCSLPRNLWTYAHRSISDWKQVYLDECDRCTVQESCCGLFAWHERGWTPAKIIPIEESVV